MSILLIDLVHTSPVLHLAGKPDVPCPASGGIAEWQIKHMPFNLHLNWNPTGQSVSSYKCKLQCSLIVNKIGQQATVWPGLQARADYNTLAFELSSELSLVKVL